MLSSFFTNTPGEGEYHLTGVVIMVSPNVASFSLLWQGAMYLGSMKGLKG